MIIYVAGPYTKGDVAENVSKAMDIGDDLIALGHSPYVPHMSHFMHLKRQRRYEDWMRVDFDFIRVSDCVLRLEGVSHGADREIALANEQGKPIVWQTEKRWKYGETTSGLLSVLNLVQTDLLQRRLIHRKID